MTDTIAIWIATIVVLFFGIDALFFDGFSAVFLARKMLLLIEWVAFWR
ncbi:hypothetical protein [Rhodobacter maris]|uniref:Glyceraldehyde-3-phosphate dehydrogenase n=1 Tax=Rhodobacter maris TaxID=446682 RepID=A0A285S4B9_9RHOB|nr:hypothetical protein [Rhodobacter maris]SOB99764.1 hypothetical protein SAMN05877831_102229 [Rhodobacter maris]